MELKKNRPKSEYFSLTDKVFTLIITDKKIYKQSSADFNIECADDYNYNNNSRSPYI